MKNDLIPLHHWVAHRGMPVHFPGNSLEGLQAALEAGASYVELDIQLSADHVPLLFHDANLQRATGVNALVADLPWEQIRTIPLLSAKTKPGRMTSLAEMVVLLGDYPMTTVFAEIKTAALRRGVEQVKNIILSTLLPLQGRCVPISFHAGLLRSIRASSAWPIGWIFETWSPRTQRQAERLSPEYLFANHARIPTGVALFPGPWQWVLYEISDPVLAWHWLKQGASLIETNDLYGVVENHDDGTRRSG